VSTLERIISTYIFRSIFFI